MTERYAGVFGETFPREWFFTLAYFFFALIVHLVSHPGFISDGKIHLWHPGLGEALILVSSVFVYLYLRHVGKHRRAVNSALEESEARYRLLVDHQSDLLVKLDDEFRLVFVSPSCCAFFNSSEQALIGQSYLSFVAEEERELAIERMRELFAPPYQSSLEHWVEKTPQGRRFLVWHHKAIRDDEGRVVGIIGVGTDVTKRRVAESEVERLASFTSENPNPVLRADSNGRLIYANPSSEGLMGYLNRSVGQILPESYLPMIGQVMESGENREIEILCGNRSLLLTFSPMIEEGYINIYGRDITRRKEAEQELWAGRERLRLATMASNIGIWDYNYEKDELIWDDMMYELYGVNSETFSHTYLDWRQRVHPEDLRAAERALKEAVDGVRPFNTDFRIIRPDGAILYIRAFGTVLNDIDGKPIRVIGANWNITEKKKTEMAISSLATISTNGGFKAFCQAVASILRDVLEVEQIFIGECKQDPPQTIGEVASSGVSSYDSSFELEGSPEARVLEDGGYVCQTNVLESFPRHKRLRLGGIEGYAGRCLRSPSGSPVGVLAVLSKAPLENLSFVEMLLDLFSVRVSAEMERDRTYMFMQKVIDGFPESLLVVNRDRTIALANRAGRLLLESENGYEPGEGPCENLICRHAGACVPDKAGCLMEQVVNTRKPTSFQYTRYDEEGKSVSVEVSLSPIEDQFGEVSHIIESSRDITDRVEAARENERLVAAVEQTDESIVITDLGGSILFVNAAFERLTGYSRDEVVGRNPRVLKSGVHSASYYKSLWQTIQRGLTWTGRLVNRRSDGSLYTEDVTISPIRDASGAIVNYVAVKTDITDELAREERYRQIQKMDSVGRLAGGIAHDFNNILQTISGFCGLLSVELSPESREMKDVEEIESVVRHASELTSQLLAFSRKNTCVHTPIDLGEVFENNMKILKQVGNGFIELDFDVVSGLGKVNADPTQVLQIVMNLAVNARDAIGDGHGTITFSLRSLQFSRDEVAGRPGKYAGRHLCLAVSDTGVGMDEEQLTHLFEPFYTTKQPGKGTGLGLSVVYGIVEDFGGWIDVESVKGVGSTFRIYLPVHGETERPEEEEPKVESASRILLVEDDSSTRNRDQEILTSAGFEVDVAGSIEEAKQFLDAGDSLPQLLIAPDRMAGEDGLELGEMLLVQSNTAAILFVTTEAVDEECSKRIKAMRAETISKPYGIKEFWDRVQRLIST